MKKVLYLDLDGVLTGFTQLYRELFNRDANRDNPLTVNQFCLQTPRFFRILPVNEQGMELFNELKTKYDIKFITTPMQNMEFCKSDKIAWVRQYLGNYDVFFTANKAEFVVDAESILIDDMDYNLKPWTEAGGTAIKFPQKKEKILQIIEGVFNPVEEVKTVREKLKNLDVDLNPTEKEKESGNYKKGAIVLKGLNIKIENIPGSFRFGFDEVGKKWVSRMKHYYGYITGTEGNDCDNIDCFIGPCLNKSQVFVINQAKNGLFDEHKIMFCFDNMPDAKDGYLSNYQKGQEKNIISIVQTNTKRLRDWLKSGNKTEPF